jgi:hypothetical protein
MFNQQHGGIKEPTIGVRVCDKQTIQVPRPE